MAKEIKVALTLDTKNFDKNIVKAKGSMRGFSAGSGQAQTSLTGLAARLAAVVTPVLAVSKGFDVLKKSLGVAAQFENVQVTLSNIVGSAEGGAAALEKIRDVARDLPVSFEELAASAPGLATVSEDIGKLEENIRKTADIAATFGIPFDVAAGQLQRAFSAGAGAADVFREKGVLAAAGFEAGVSYSVEETIKKLDELSQKVKGASEELNKTFSGAVNQAGDAVTDFQAALGDALKPEVTALLQELTKRFRDNEEQIMAVAKAIGTSVLNAFIKFGRAVAITIDFLRKLFAPVQAFNDGLKALGTNLPIVATSIYVVVKAQQAFRTATLAAANAFIFLQGVTGVGLLKVGAGIAAAAATTAALTVAFDKASEAISNTDEEVGGVTGQFNDLVDIFLTGGDQIRDDIDQTKEKMKELGDATKINLTNAKQSFDDFVASFNSQIEKLDAAIFGILGTPEFITIFTTAFLEMVQAMDDTQKQSVLLFQAINSIDSAFATGLPTLSEVNQLIEYLTENYKELGLNADDLPDIINRINQQFEDQEGIRNFIDSLESATKSLGTDLATAFLEGEKAGDSFKKFFKTLVTQIIADVIRLSIIQPILGAILAPFGFGFGSGGSIVKLPRQFGGPVMKNKPYVVGERGPELFVPSGTGSIIPNNQLGGTSTTVNYNIQAVDAPSFQALVARDPEFIYAVTTRGARSVMG